jgi:phage shock protein E
MPPGIQMTRSLAYFVRIALCCLLAAACSPSEPTPRPPPAPPATSSRPPDSAREIIASGALVIDVRTADEYADDHLPNAVNIPVQELGGRLDEVAALVANDKTRPIVVHCAAGTRAAKAKAQLEAAGYSRVVNGGGLDDLR